MHAIIPLSSLRMARRKARIWTGVRCREERWERKEEEEEGGREGGKEGGSLRSLLLAVAFGREGRGEEEEEAGEERSRLKRGFSSHRLLLLLLLLLLPLPTFLLPPLVCVATDTPSFLPSHLPSIRACLTSLQITITRASSLMAWERKAR